MIHAITARVSPKMLKAEIDTFVQEVQECVGEVSLENISTLVSMIMMKASYVKKLNGQEKKQLVIYTLYVLIDEVVDEETYNKYKLIIETVVPNTIDLIIDVSKNKLIFKEIFVEKVWKFLEKCCVKKPETEDVENEDVEDEDVEDEEDSAKSNEVVENDGEVKVEIP